MHPQIAQYDGRTSKWLLDCVRSSHHASEPDGETTPTPMRTCVVEWSPSGANFCELRIPMASTSSCGFEGQTKSPVYVLEENGHLQHRLFNVLLLIGDGVRGPHFLRNHSASAHDSAVKKKPRRGLERLPSRNEEEKAFSVGVRRSFNQWNVALQQVVVVSLSSTTVESIRYVAVDEKRSVHRTWHPGTMVCHARMSHFQPYSRRPFPKCQRTSLIYILRT